MTSRAKPSERTCDEPGCGRNYKHTSRLCGRHRARQDRRRKGFYCLPRERIEVSTEDILMAWARGHSGPEIAQTFDLGVQTVYNRLATASAADRVEALYWAGAEDVEIASKLGMSIWAVGRARRKRGLLRVQAGSEDETPYLPTDGIVDFVAVATALSGKAVRLTADETALTRWLSERAPEFTQRFLKNAPLDADMSELFALLHPVQVSNYELSRILECH